MSAIKPARKDASLRFSSPADGAGDSLVGVERTSSGRSVCVSLCVRVRSVVSNCMAVAFQTPLSMGLSWQE